MNVAILQDAVIALIVDPQAFSLFCRDRNLFATKWGMGDREREVILALDESGVGLTRRVVAGTRAESLKATLSGLHTRLGDHRWAELIQELHTNVVIRDGRGNEVLLALVKYLHESFPRTPVCDLASYEAAVFFLSLPVAMRDARFLANARVVGARSILLRTSTSLDTLLDDDVELALYVPTSGSQSYLLHTSPNDPEISVLAIVPSAGILLERFCDGTITEQDLHESLSADDETASLSSYLADLEGILARAHV